MFTLTLPLVYTATASTSGRRHAVAAGASLPPSRPRRCASASDPASFSAPRPRTDRPIEDDRDRLTR